MNKIQLHTLLPNVFANRKDVVSDIWLKDVEIEKGRNYLLEANSGTGKSSLLSYIYGYRKDYQGRILFDNKDIRTLSISNWMYLRVHVLSMLWQDLRLFPELTALENVMVKNNLTKFQKKKNIMYWFDRLGIADKKDTKIGKMSFGQQQRVALIRSLCQPFDFIFLDEPISHLDDSNSALMSDILLSEAREQGASVVVTSIGKRMNIDYDHIYRI